MMDRDLQATTEGPRQPSQDLLGGHFYAMRYTVRMRPTLAFFIISFFCLLLLASPAKAIEIETDPQYVIMNFATINELNWAAPEEEWKQDIKPAITAQIQEMRSALESASGESQGERLLGWSTLMEYMNFPLDEPGPTSVYAIKTRRILEIADELNFPVFLPLNGFQWWDQLPELYNWWDPDGTHTDPAFFARQKNPKEFKQRFIAGYDPDNKWNVEWQDWKTPMGLNYRNWGGGGFRLAPPPNLSSAQTGIRSYRQVLIARLKVIVDELLPVLSRWQQEDRLNLFAGLSIGTEISLNASTKPRDEFLPYGFRAVQDRLCPPEERTCGQSKKFTPAEIEEARQTTVNNLLVDLTRRVNARGIPRQRIYTHVWGEALAKEARHVNYAAAAYTLYSRPGMSFYGYAHDPLSLPDWRGALKQSGYPSWGAIEYSAGKSSTQWSRGLSNTLDNPTDPAQVMVIYNWQEHKGTGAVSALHSFLSQPRANRDCTMPLILPTLDHSALRPVNLSWKLIGNPTEPLILHIKAGIKTTPDAPDVVSKQLNPDSTLEPVPELPAGSYSWYLETRGCGNRAISSEARTFILVPQFAEPNPKWVDWLLDLLSRFKDFGRAIIPTRP